MTKLVQHQNEENKQIGCMSSFFQIFDRHHILAGRRVHSTKRLPPSKSVGASPERVNSDDSPEFKQKLGDPNNHLVVVVTNTSDKSQSSLITIDGDNKQLKPPSVVAKLMGLEYQKAPQSYMKPEIPRSGSECRVSKDRIHSKYIDGNNFQVKQPTQSQKQSLESSPTSSWRSPSLSHSSSSDLLSSTNQTTTRVIMHEHLEKKLKMRGMDEHFNNLTTLKQILEVLQLKRLDRTDHWNFVYDRNLYSQQSKIAMDSNQMILVKAKTNATRNRIESNLKSCNSINKWKPLSIEIRRQSNNVSDPLTISPPSNSPKHCNNVFDSIVTDDELTYVSESIVSASSTTDSQRYGSNSTVEMNSSTESPPSSATVLPSPVSVLDSGFDNDESLSPSHSIDFRATTIDFKDEYQSPKILLSPTKSTKHDEFTSNDSDFIYITHILQTSKHLHEDPNLFFSIEKQLYKITENTSNASKLQRKLVFDVIIEIMDRNKELTPLNALVECSRTSVKQIWSEFQKIREMNIDEGVFELNDGVLKKDIVRVNGWDDYTIETSEAILDIERMIFRDLVSEAIGEFAEFSSGCLFSRTRRKLVF
ncbi:hypothetical protein QVD17_03080 [Tagetes erecta]|uniref:DUF4378 domain-containing protein n=1 Tax=Tagetes erecta TaxID=13708 RepID=A0AAD8LGV4_TARER|nr:hypothetical protein QVD17_03080 [Tagetes erecta]